MFSYNLSTFFEEILKAAGGWGDVAHQSVSGEIFLSFLGKEVERDGEGFPGTRCSSLLLGGS